MKFKQRQFHSRVYLNHINIYCKIKGIYSNINQLPFTAVQQRRNTVLLLEAHAIHQSINLNETINIIYTVYTCIKTLSTSIYVYITQLLAQKRVCCLVMALLTKSASCQCSAANNGYN